MFLIILVIRIHFILRRTRRIRLRFVLIIWTAIQTSINCIIRFTFFNILNIVMTFFVPFMFVVVMVMMVMMVRMCEFSLEPRSNFTFLAWQHPRWVVRLLHGTNIYICSTSLRLNNHLLSYLFIGCLSPVLLIGTLIYCS